MSEVTRRTLLAGAAANALAAGSQILDPHVHVWKHDPAFPFAEGARVPERDAAPETLLALMKANGVSQNGDHPGDPLQVRQSLSWRAS